MIFVIGGAFQGKREFAEERFRFGERAGSETEGCDAGGTPFSWQDGTDSSWEEFCRAGFCCHLEAMVRRRMEEAGIEAFSGEAFLEELFSFGRKKVILTDEISSGIVPMEPFERAWREEAGRISCRIAAQAEEVWRVFAGVGQRLK